MTAPRSLAGGRYALEEHLGSGGMASVWLATDTRLDRRVAVKLISDVLAHDERWLARFSREARAAASLSHPNIVPVYDFGVEDGRPYIVMHHVDGGSLKERLADGAAPEPARLARELLGALAHVHAAGIVHRDVKPGNVLLDRAGRSHLTDFGIARPSDATAMTQTGVVLGTARYIAPEVAAGEPATAASGLYSAGRVLREVAGDQPAQPLGRLIEALTDEDPARRPASAEAALARIDGDETAATRVMTGGGMARARPSPRLVPAAGLAAVAVIAVLVVAIASGGGADSDQPPVAERAAPASAPLEKQLDALDRMIEGAAR
jgi:eukaryotic-like serine/threonine-protein kinase